MKGEGVELHRRRADQRIISSQTESTELSYITADSHWLNSIRSVSVTNPLKSGSVLSHLSTNTSWFLDPSADPSVEQHHPTAKTSDLLTQSLATPRMTICCWNSEKNNPGWLNLKIHRMFLCSFCVFDIMPSSFCSVLMLTEVSCVNTWSKWNLSAAETEWRHNRQG